MQWIRSYSIYLTLAAVGLFLAPVSVCAGYFITHSSNPTNQITQKQARAIYTLRFRSWNNGDSIKIFVLPDKNREFKDFVKSRLELYPHHLRKTWDRALFTGQGQVPVEVKTEEEMIEKVSNSPGSIGFISLPPKAKFPPVKTLNFKDSE